MYPDLVSLKITKGENLSSRFLFIISGRDWCYVFFQPRSQVNYSLSSSPFHFYFCLFSPRRPGSKRDVTEGTVAEGSNINFPYKTEIHLIQFHVVNIHLKPISSILSSPSSSVSPCRRPEGWGKSPSRGGQVDSWGWTRCWEQEKL